MRPSLKIALIYIFIGGTWVAFSSLYLDVFMKWFQFENSNYLEALKAVLFVVVSGLIMYGLMERSFRLEKKVRDQYVEIFETSPIPMLVLDKKDLRVMVGNKMSNAVFSFKTSDNGGGSFLEQIKNWNQKDAERMRSQNRGKIVEREILARDGLKRLVDIYFVPFIFKEKESVMVMLVDNTEIHKILKEKDSLNQYLQQQNGRLRKLSFINSHQLRSPLSNIMGIIGLLGEGGKTDKEIVEMLKFSSEQLDNEIRKMNELLQDQGIDPKMEETGKTKKAKTILFVDDDKVQHMINKRVLLGVQSDLDLHFFANPMDALSWLEDHEADVLLLDINMPEMNGWEFLDKLVGIEKQPYVMMLSSSIDPNDEKKSQEYGMVNGFLTKPLDKVRVTELLEL